MGTASNFQHRMTLDTLDPATAMFADRRNWSSLDLLGEDPVLAPFAYKLYALGLRTGHDFTHQDLTALAEKAGLTQEDEEHLHTLKRSLAAA